MKKHLNIPVGVKGEDTIALSAKVRENRIRDGYKPNENGGRTHLGDVVDRSDVEIQNSKKIKLEKPVLASAVEADGGCGKKECGGE